MNTSSDPRSSISRTELNSISSFLQSLAKQCRELTISELKKRLTVSIKQDSSLVTQIDTKIETFLRSEISQAYPTHGIVGEEQPCTNPESEWQWLLDPIDGTEELVNRLPIYGTIIGLHYCGLPVAGVIDHPELDWLLSAVYQRGTWFNGKRIELAPYTQEIQGHQRIGISRRAHFSRIGNHCSIFDRLLLNNPNHRIYACAFNHSCTTIGSLDAHIDWAIRGWDIAAARILVEEAGGKFVSVYQTNEPLSQRRFCAIFGKPSVVDYLIDIVDKESLSFQV